MKILIRTGLFILIAGLVITACRPAEYKEIGTPKNVLSSISGQWKLIRATQTDEDAKAKGFPFKELDITNLFPYTDFRITLNLNNGVPGTFTTTPGNSPKIIKLASGNWDVDDEQFPEEIILVNGTAFEEISLGAYPTGSATTLKLKVERRDAGTGKLLITYSYEFAKQ